MPKSIVLIPNKFLGLFPSFLLHSAWNNWSHAICYPYKDESIINEFIDFKPFEPQVYINLRIPKFATSLVVRRIHKDYPKFSVFAILHGITSCFSLPLLVVFDYVALYLHRLLDGLDYKVTLLEYCCIAFFFLDIYDHLLREIQFSHINWRILLISCRIPHDLTIWIIVRLLRLSALMLIWNVTCIDWNFILETFCLSSIFLLLFIIVFNHQICSTVFLIGLFQLLILSVRYWVAVKVFECFDNLKYFVDICEWRCIFNKLIEILLGPLEVLKKSLFLLPVQLVLLIPWLFWLHEAVSIGSYLLLYRIYAFVNCIY